MIGQLSGMLSLKHPPWIVLEVGGVGYEVEVPMSTFYLLPQTGEAVRLYTHLTVREDAHLLYGFATQEERTSFRQLIRVNGIGPRIALALLSTLSVEELARAVDAGNGTQLARTPGIGKKIAERLILELRGKLAGTRPGTHATTQSGSPGAPPGIAAPHPHHEILGALLGLGYSEREGTQAIRTLPDDVPLNEGIRLALRALARKE